MALKRKISELSKEIDVLEGEEGAIELDPNNANHVDWYEGR